MLTLGRAHRGGMDQVATATSAVCAVHCALTPIVLPLLPVALGHFVGPELETIFVSTSIILGVASLGYSYRALHRNVFPLASFSVGMIVLLLSKTLSHPSRRLDLTAVIAGASCIIAGHLINLRLSRRAHADGACISPQHRALQP